MTRVHFTPAPRDFHGGWTINNPTAAFTIRRHYRTLRRAGLDKWAARWFVMDLFQIGRFAADPIRMNDVAGFFNAGEVEQ
jgi:hypothetical protein